jgi:NTE family protein
MAGASNMYDLLTYVWSDIFDLHLEFAGDESEHDQVIIRGSIENKSFTILYLKQKVLMAYFAINTSAKEYPTLQRLIRHKKDLTGKETQLKDPKFALKQLA